MRHSRFWMLVGLLAFSLWGCGDPSDASVPGVAAAEPETGNAGSQLAADGFSEADWSQFRGPAGLGTANVAELPLHWSPSEHIIWKTPLPGAGASSPIVFGEQIYLTAYSGYAVPGADSGNLTQLQRHLLAISRETGKLLWDRQVPAVLPEEEHIRDHGYAASTPAADSEHVYVFFGKSGVIAFDHQGTKVWSANVGTQTNGWGSAASPVLYRDLVLINASVESESLVALDRRTGQEVWRAPGINEAWNTPLIVSNGEQDEFVVATHGKILAFNPHNGAALWNCDTDITWYMAPSMVFHEGVIYAIGGRAGVTALAVKCGGTGDVTATQRLWTSETGSNVSSPVYHNGHLYFVNDARGVASCLDAKTGDIVYEQRLECAEQNYASALLGAGHIYYLDRSGRTFVIAAQPEFKQVASNELRDGGVYNASPVVVGDQLLIRSDKFLYCIGK